MHTLTSGQQLAHFAANLRFENIPDPVIRRTEDLMLDWLGSTLAGKDSRPVESIARFMESMGPQTGPCEVLIHRRGSSPLVAAACNAAASHVAEQDDVHNGSVFHPGAVVFPAALSAAQAIGASGAEFLTAVVAGYEVGIRVGEFLGRSHYRIFHTTGTAGTLAACAAVGRLLRLTPEQMENAFGSAGTQAAGLWEFLRDAADSKQLHTAHAASAGLTAAYLAQDGFTGAKRILEGLQGMGAGMSQDADERCLTHQLGTRWALAETSFKFHASCRHTHPAADALQKVMQEHRLAADDISKVTTLVHQGAIDVLGPVIEPKTVHQSKFSMGTVLGLIAVRGCAGLPEFDAFYDATDVVRFREKVVMQLDVEVDSAYPSQWIGKVLVEMTDGRIFSGRVDEPKGDPGNTMNRDELQDKAIRLAQYRSGATETEMLNVIQRIWSLSDSPRITTLFQ